jgi:hypothetical protein
MDPAIAGNAERFFTTELQDRAARPRGGFASGSSSRQRATQRPDNVVDGKCEEECADQRAYLLVCKPSPLGDRPRHARGGLLTPANECRLSKLRGVHRPDSLHGPRFH